jgi:FkbM family methyltransferase
MLEKVKFLRFDMGKCLLNRRLIRFINYLIVIGGLCILLGLYKAYRIKKAEEKRFLDKLVGANVFVQVDEAILSKTEDLANLSPDHPDLVEFVASLILKPAAAKMMGGHKKPTLKETYEEDDASYVGISRKLDKAMSYKRDGFFVEAGGFNGEDASNTLFFELQRNWTGILVEPIPYQFKSILAKNRNIYALNACISSTNKPQVLEFLVLGQLSGVASEMHSTHLKYLNFLDKKENRKSFKLRVPCFPFATILKALDRRTVDYFSLDVEGAELSILKTIDFGQFKFDTITVEWHQIEKVKQQVTQLLDPTKFQLIGETHLDLLFKNLNF